MPSITTSYDSPVTTGANREDLGDVIYDISPEETPVMSMGRREDADATRTEWLTEALSAPSPNGVIEAHKPDDTEANVPTRLGNVTQINERVVTISGTQQAVKSAGSFGKLNRETARKMKEMKRDQEAALLRNQPLVAGNESTARQTRSLIHFVTATTNVIGYTPAASETAAIGAFDGGAAFTLAKINTLMQTGYTVGAQPSKMILSPVNKATAAAFTGKLTQLASTNERKVTTNVTVIETPFGILDLVVDRFFPATAAGSDFVPILDPEYFGVAWLRKTGRTALAKTGDLDNWMVNNEWCAKVHNPNAHLVLGYDQTPP